MHRTVVAAILTAALGVGLAAWQNPTRIDGDAMERKLSAITSRGDAASGPATAPVRTTITDRELNAYLMFNGQSRLPVGLREPRVTLPAANRFDGRAIVDLDEVRKARDYGLLGVLLQGSMEIKLSGTIAGSGGKGTVHIASASLNGVPIAQSLVEILINHFSKTPDLPNGFQLDKPFTLPSRIRELQVRSGAITVVQ